LNGGVRLSDHFRCRESKKKKKKKTIQALSKAHMRLASANQFDDFVIGKGQGFIVLLENDI
jgi:hypothetical protein